MQQYGDVVLKANPSGVATMGKKAEVTVYLAGTRTRAALFLDNGGTVLANPFNAQDDGSFKFCAADGTYDLYVGGAFIKTVTLFDPTAPTAASSVEFQAAITGAQVRTVQDKLRERVSLADFAGFDPTGATGSDAAIASALAALPNGGQIIVPFGSTVLLGSPIVTHKPHLFVGEVRGDITSNTNGSSSATPRMVWAGASGATMFTVVPANTGDVIFGGGSVGIEWDGEALAAYAVHLNNTKCAQFDGKARNVTAGAVLVSSLNGAVGNFSQLNRINLDFVWGVAAACQNAHGVILKGNGSNVPATQQRLGTITGLIYNGSMVQIAETDNCSVEFINASVQSGGTGCGLELKAGGAQGANHNVVWHIAGPIKQDNGLSGNKFLHYVSEGGGITQTSGSASWDGELTDYVTGRVYASHKYPLRKKIGIPSSALVGNAQATSGYFCLVWQCLMFPKAQPGPAVYTFLPPDYDLSNGTLEGVEVMVGTNGTSAGNVNLSLGLVHGQPGTDGFTTPQQSLTQTFAAPSQYHIQSMAFSFTQAFTLGDLVGLKVTRNSGAGADTNADDLYVLGARILYKSAGPDSAGSGTNYIPAWV